MSIPRLAIERPITMFMLSAVVILIGGMVHNPGFVQSLKGALGVDKVHLPDMPEYISALGAALIAADGDA